MHLIKQKRNDDDDDDDGDDDGDLANALENTWHNKKILRKCKGEKEKSRE